MKLLTSKDSTLRVKCIGEALSCSEFAKNLVGSKKREKVFFYFPPPQSFGLELACKIHAKLSNFWHIWYKFDRFILKMHCLCLVYERQLNEFLKCWHMMHGIFCKSFPW